MCKNRFCNSSYTYWRKCDLDWVTHINSDTDTQPHVDSEVLFAFGNGPKNCENMSVYEAWSWSARPWQHKSQRSLNKRALTEMRPLPTSRFRPWAESLVLPFLLFFLLPSWSYRSHLEVKDLFWGDDWSDSIHRRSPSWGFPGISSAVN